MKKLIMFFMVLMLCLGFVGESKAEPDCVTICPAGGPDDEITLTVYDEEGEFFDLTEIPAGTGVSIVFWEPDGEFYIQPGDPEMVDGSVEIVLGELLYNAVYCEMVVEGVAFILGVNKEGPGFDDFPDAVDAGGTCPEEIPVCREKLSPIVIDPNVMLVYEEGETIGDFGVSMKNALPTGETATVTVDPNLATEDIMLFRGDPCDGTITLTFNDSNWDVPQKVAFKAIDDEIADLPDLLEQQSIVATSVYSETLQDPNWAGEKIVKVFVMDNDQANILFSVTPPVWLKEEPLGEDWFGDPIYKEVTVGVTLQVEPSGGDVEIIVTNESDYPPIMDPPLTTASDPNSLIFTTANWDVSQPITIWANDDDVLQIEEAEAEGDQNYQAEIVFTVVDDGGDTRYTDLERTLDIDIEDNECGAFGISYLDIANSSGEDEPDCYVDIYDIIEFATKWLDCSDPQDAGCESYL